MELVHPIPSRFTSSRPHPISCPIPIHPVIGPQSMGSSSSTVFSPYFLHSSGAFAAMAQSPAPHYSMCKSFQDYHYLSPPSSPSWPQCPTPPSRADGSPSPLFTIVSQPSSLRRQILLPHSSGSSIQIPSPPSSISTATPSTSPIPPSAQTVLPCSGDNSRVDPRHLHHYSNIRFQGVYGASSPLDRIRVWRDPTGQRLYDCVCGKRIPNSSLHKVKRHAYRHAVSSYTCPTCGKVFAAHWSLNAHCRIHKSE
uniref:C2H2-type domain-containing protein n=1 Tax=Spongospora subterranea TaxID=70186 RepID=A0A0H5RCP2_9EUKA|eukprot:CRZ11521.1 hypothetical protein [Spongospora subterranea]